MERPAKERLIGAIVIVTVAWLLIPVFLDEGGGDTDTVVSRELALPDADTRAGTPMRRETVVLTEPGTEPAREPEPATATITALPLPATTTTEDPASHTPSNDGAGAGAGDSDSELTVPDDSSTATQASTAAAAVGTPPETTADETPPAAVDASASEAQQAEPQSTPPVETGGDGQLWAVQVGSFSDRDNAQRLAGELRAKGLLAFLSQVQSGGRTLHRVRVGPQASRAEAEAVANQLKTGGQASAAVVRHP